MAVESIRGQWLCNPVILHNNNNYKYQPVDISTVTVAILPTDRMCPRVLH